MVKQRKHIRKYKSGKRKVINPHIKKRNYNMFPLGKESDLKIAWDKEKLKEIYELEEINPKRITGEHIYETSAKGIKVIDPVSRDYKFKKIPYSQLSPVAKLESNLIKGGFFNPKTGEIVKLKTRRRF